jgi:hypothetical protein
MLPTWSYGFSYDGFFSKHILVGVEWIDAQDSGQARPTKGQLWNDEMMVPVNLPRAMRQVLGEA